MKTALFCYTGTGNSLWAARTLARELGEAELFPMAPPVPEEAVRAEAVGLVFPVHIWGLPRRVVDFVNSSITDPSRYYFAVALNAGQVAATLLQLKKMLGRKGATLSSGSGIVMPSNYIPWGGPGPEEERRRRFAGAEEKIRQIAATVRNRKRGPVEKGPLWQNAVFSLINRLTFDRVPGMDKSFRTDPECNGCGICESVCPGGNIRLEEEGRPVWLHHCEQCLACIQWCPREALQFGKRTPRYPRYHHPEVTLKDMVAMARTIRGEAFR